VVGFPGTSTRSERAWSIAQNREAVTDHFTRHDFSGHAFQLERHSAQQNQLTTWIEYLHYETLLDGRHASCFKSAKGTYHLAWKKLVEPNALRPSDTEESVSNIDSKYHRQREIHEAIEAKRGCPFRERARAMRQLSLGRSLSSPTHQGLLTRKNRYPTPTPKIIVRETYAKPSRLRGLSVPGKSTWDVPTIAWKKLIESNALRPSDTEESAFNIDFKYHRQSEAIKAKRGCPFREIAHEMRQGSKSGSQLSQRTTRTEKGGGSRTRSGNNTNQTGRGYEVIGFDKQASKPHLGIQKESVRLPGNEGPSRAPGHTPEMNYRADRRHQACGNRL
jgi:hypothetical protein